MNIEETMMKRTVLCLLLITALLLSLSACKKQNETTGDPETSAVLDASADISGEATDPESEPAETAGESSATATDSEPLTADSVSSAPTEDTVPATDAPVTRPSVTTPSPVTSPITAPPTTNLPVTNPPVTEPPHVTEPCRHVNTEVRNRLEATTSAAGYTGDTYCRECGSMLSCGWTIPRIQQIDPEKHSYYDMEMRILNEINAERAKAGLNALAWDEELYAGAQIRAKEYYEYRGLNIGTGPHTRHDGSLFLTAVTENSSYTEGSFAGWAENCAGDTGGNDFVASWMESSGHRENILRPEMQYIAIGIYLGDFNMYYASTIFVG